MTGRDEYYNRAKQEGYRTRAAYKLQQLDAECDLIGPHDAVVDLGAAPGGWLQVARERTDGPVVGVDRQRIDPIDAVDIIRGDMTQAATRERVREAVGEADLVLSDLAPEMTGEYELDHARSIHLARQALRTACDVLAAGGDFVVKVFDGPDLAAFREDVADEFEYVRAVHPDASRDSSSETYLVGKGRLTAPVRANDELVVAVTDTGSEGDGVAKVDGYTLFVPDATPGEEVRVRVEDVKPRYGFAKRLN